MKIIVCADGNSVNIFIIEKLVIVIHSPAAAVFFHGGIGALRNYIAEGNYLSVLTFEISRYMRGIRYVSASDDCNSYFV